MLSALTISQTDLMTEATLIFSNLGVHPGIEEPGGSLTTMSLVLNTAKEALMIIKVALSQISFLPKSSGLLKDPLPPNVTSGPSPGMSMWG